MLGGLSFGVVFGLGLRVSSFRVFGDSGSRLLGLGF